MKRWTRNSVTVLAGLWLASVGAWAQSVSLELKSGDRITGRIISETPERVVLSNAWSRELTIPIAEISKRTTVASTANAVVVAPSATNSPAKPTNGVALAKAVAATNMLFTSPLMKNWHGDILIGADLTFSERNRQVYNARAKLIYANAPLKSVLDYDATYGRSEVVETVNGVKTSHQQTDANRMGGAWKLDYDITKKWYLYNLAGVGYDEIRKIDLRYEVGPGIGYHLVQATNFFLNTEVGANYQKEERSDDTELSRFYARVGQNCAWKITPRLSWDEKVEYLPSVEDVDIYKIRFETNLRYALLQNLFLNFSLIDTYDSRPADGVTQNDLQLRSSIGVKF